MLAKAVIRDRPRRQLSTFASRQQFLREIKAEETYRRLVPPPTNQVIMCDVVEELFQRSTAILPWVF